MDRKDLLAKIDEFHDEIEESSERIKVGATYQEVRAVIDRWDFIRSQVFRSEKEIERALYRAKKLFDDKFRDQAANRRTGMRGGDLAYEERKEFYITTCLDEYKQLRIAEGMRDELHRFMSYLKNKEYWVYQLQRELLREEDNSRYVRQMEYNIVKGKD